MNYYRDEIGDVDNDASDNKSSKYKTKIIGKTEASPTRQAQPDPNQDWNQTPQPTQPPIPPLNTKVTIPLKYLSNFWRSLDLSLINCEVELDLKWSKNFVLIEKNNHRIGVSFILTCTKLYVPIIILSKNNDNITFLENIIQGYKRAISWNNYRSEITAQPKNNNSDYLIDPTFRNINRFDLLFKMVTMTL